MPETTTTATPEILDVFERIRDAQFYRPQTSVHFDLNASLWEQNGPRPGLIINVTHNTTPLGRPR